MFVLHVNSVRRVVDAFVPAQLAHDVKFVFDFSPQIFFVHFDAMPQKALPLYKLLSAVLLRALIGLVGLVGPMGRSGMLQHKVGIGFEGAKDAVENETPAKQKDLRFITETRRLLA